MYQIKNEAGQLFGYPTEDYYEAHALLTEAVEMYPGEGWYISAS